MYFLYKVVHFVALSLPRKAIYAIASFIANVYYILSKKDKAALVENIKIILKDTKNSESPYYYARLNFINFAKYLVDFFRFSKLDSNFIKKYVDIEGIDYLENALKNKKGAILLSSHIGNWELGGVVASLLGYPIYAIALDHKDKRINAFFINQRKILGVCVIPIGPALKKCFKILNENKALAILGDRDFSESGKIIDFFGKETLLPKGPAVFSLRTGSPIIPVFMLRQKGDRFKFVFEKPINHKPKDNKEEDIKNLMSSYIKVIERYIRNYPDQWHVFRSVWNET